MTRTRTRTRTAVGTAAAALLTIVLAASCSTPAGRTASVRATPTPTPTPTLTPSAAARPAASTGDPYLDAVAAAHDRGLTVWVEADLAKRWLEGPDAYQTAMARVEILARQPGVAGVKIADELGYDDGLDRQPADMRAFVTRTAATLRRSVPGTRVMVDMVIPDLGCLPHLAAVAAWSRSCIAAADAEHPALALPAVDELLATGGIDVLNLSTGLLDGSEYEDWGVDRDDAQRAAWAEATRRGWPALVTLNARKALAHPGSYPGDATTARDDVTTFVGVPRAEGAQAVDVWTWHQSYKDDTYRLMDPGLHTNALWQALGQERAAGAELMTHFTPSSVEVSVDSDLDQVATVFGAVLIAAGTG